MWFSHQSLNCKAKKRISPKSWTIPLNYWPSQTSWPSCLESSGRSQDSHPPGAWCSYQQTPLVVHVGPSPPVEKESLMLVSPLPPFLWGTTQENFKWSHMGQLWPKWEGGWGAELTKPSSSSCKQSRDYGSIFRSRLLTLFFFFPFYTPITSCMSGQELVSPVIIFGYNEPGQKSALVKSRQKRFNGAQVFMDWILWVVFFPLPTIEAGWKMWIG